MNLDLRASGLLALLLIVLAACDVFRPSIATAQELGPIKLTEKQMQNFIAAHQEMAKLYAGADPDKPDPKLEAQAEAIAKKNGFSSLAEHAAVTMISRSHATVATFELGSYPALRAAGWRSTDNKH